MTPTPTTTTPATTGRRRTRGPGRWARLVPVLVLALLAGACSALGGGGNTYEISAEFTRAFNLFPGSEVRLLGHEVGRILDVEAESGRQTVLATMQIDGDVELPSDAEAHIIQGALLGERYIELTPPYTGEGEAMADGALIPVERTGVPAEFDEVLESLNDFLDAIPPDELGRLVRNAAGTLEGQGGKLGETLDAAAGAIDALEVADDDLAGLIADSATLNETLATRDEEIAALIEDWAAVVDTLAAERDALGAALAETARMVREIRALVDGHLGHLQGDVEALTRVGRTLNRNLEEIDLLLEGQSELYRHSERVFDREKNWLPLVNHDEDLGRMLEDRLGNRLAGVCERLDLTVCADPEFWDGELPEELCFPPIFPCPDDGGGDDGDSPLPGGDDLPGGDELPELPGLPDDGSGDDGGDGDGGDDGGGEGPLDDILPGAERDVLAVPLGVALEHALDAVPELRQALDERGIGLDLQPRGDRPLLGADGGATAGSEVPDGGPSRVTYRLTARQREVLLR